MDDLIATGGTAKSVAKILRREGKEISGLLTVVGLKEFGKRQEFDFPADSIIEL